MRKKRILFSAALFSLVSLVSAQGYGQGINRTLNPESIQHVYTLWQTMGWHLAAILMLPLLAYFLIGVYEDEHKRENFWMLGIIMFFVSLGIIGLYPLVLLHI